MIFSKELTANLHTLFAGYTSTPHWTQVPNSIQLQFAAEFIAQVHYPETHEFLRICALFSKNMGSALKDIITNKDGSALHEIFMRNLYNVFETKIDQKLDYLFSEYYWKNNNHRFEQAHYPHHF